MKGWLLFGVLVVSISACSGEKLHGKFSGLDGSLHTVQELQGRVTVVNLWTTWCVPCRVEMPLLDGLAKEYATRQVTFVAISIDDAKTRSKIPAFVNQVKVQMPVWEGATTDDLNQWSGDGIVPATLILDERGEIVARLANPPAA